MLSQGHRRQTLQSCWGTSHTLNGIFAKRSHWKKFRVQIHDYILFKCDFEVSSLEGIWGNWLLSPYFDRALVTFLPVTLFSSLNIGTNRTYLVLTPTPKKWRKGEILKWTAEYMEVTYQDVELRFTSQQTAVCWWLLILCVGVEKLTHVAHIWIMFTTRGHWVLHYCDFCVPWCSLGASVLPRRFGQHILSSRRVTEGVLGGAWEDAQLMLLVWGPHFENSRPELRSGIDCFVL